MGQKESASQVEKRRESGIEWRIGRHREKDFTVDHKPLRDCGSTDGVAASGYLLYDPYLPGPVCLFLCSM